MSEYYFQKVPGPSPTPSESNGGPLTAGRVRVDTFLNLQ